MTRLTRREQVRLQTAYIHVRDAIQQMLVIDKDRKLTGALNKLFDTADIMEDYIQSTKEGNHEPD